MFGKLDKQHSVGNHRPEVLLMRDFTATVGLFKCALFDNIFVRINDGHLLSRPGHLVFVGRTGNVINISFRYTHPSFSTRKSGTRVKTRLLKAHFFVAAVPWVYQTSNYLQFLLFFRKYVSRIHLDCSGNNKRSCFYFVVKIFLCRNSLV